MLKGSCQIVFLCTTLRKQQSFGAFFLLQPSMLTVNWKKRIHLKIVLKLHICYNIVTQWNTTPIM